MVKETAAARSAWQAGDVDRAARLAAAAGDEQLPLLADLVRGRLAEALSRYDRLRRPRRALDLPIADALLHLDQPGRACEHLRRRHRRIPPKLALQRDHPMSLKAAGPVELPFADQPLAPYLPAVEATLNGRRTLLHLDTGGTFLVMGSERAAAVGVQSVSNGRLFHGVTSTHARAGLVGELNLGGTVLTNVPVDILPTLAGPQDLVIMGTCLLRRFLSTIDTPGDRLLLAPRGSAVPPGGTRMPFHLWGDHFMFAAGGYGELDLTFFVDSGLVQLLEDGGTLRQAAVYATKSQYRSWGFAPGELSGTHLRAARPLRLGPLEQDGHLLSIAPGRRAPWSELGGVRVDGLISQAFLAQYAWTLDFDRHEYIFRPG
ncbi:retropepsin-like aspartic protease [Rhizohabitans arisaemae]|uniref:retropepsin-like aspartic protease n=1 Tax=Rhizohabitans arisaemae TaxID=2720610 RepID=UPI0024B1BFFD|nr:retropepsin-like aspartic protease [Rhizohabitans arisaemae]